MKYLLKKRIFGVIFLMLVLTFSVANFVYVLPSLKYDFRKGKYMPSDLSKSVTTNILGKMELVETYSFVQRALGKKEFQNFDIIKDNEGYLHYSSFYKERNSMLFEYAHRVMRLSHAVGGKGTKVIFVATPSKFLNGEVKLEPGLRGNDPYDNVQELLMYLHRLGIHTLDLSSIFSDSSAPYLSHFYRTDHHWNSAAAFKATRLLVEDIRETYGDDFDPDDFYTNEANYKVTNYPQCMLGSMGRRTGICFSGKEDFEFYEATFPGNYERISKNGDDTDVYKGDYLDALMKSKLLIEGRDIYQESMYDVYLDGINAYDRIVNLSIPEGEGKNILFVNDSYFSPVISFMAPMCGTIDRVYNLSTGEEARVEALLAENTYDYVIIEVYPYNLNNGAFNYFMRR